MAIQTLNFSHRRPQSFRPWGRSRKNTKLGRAQGRALPPKLCVTNVNARNRHCEACCRMLQMAVANRAWWGFRTGARRCAPRVKNAPNERARRSGRKRSVPAGRPRSVTGPWTPAPCPRDGLRRPEDATHRQHSTTNRGATGLQRGCDPWPTRHRETRRRGRAASPGECLRAVR